MCGVKFYRLLFTPFAFSTVRNPPRPSMPSRAGIMTAMSMAGSAWTVAGSTPPTTAANDAKGWTM